MFLHVSFSHSVHKGVGSASVHAWIANTPPPPGSRPSREQTPDPHGTRPPRTRPPPPCAVHAGRAGGTHPTGMHTCF